MSSCTSLATVTEERSLSANPPGPSSCPCGGQTFHVTARAEVAVRFSVTEKEVREHLRFLVQVSGDKTVDPDNSPITAETVMECVRLQFRDQLIHDFEPVGRAKLLPSAPDTVIEREVWRKDYEVIE